MKDGRHGLVFPNGAGNVENHGNIARRGLTPTMIAAGIVTPELDARADRNATATASRSSSRSIQGCNAATLLRLVVHQPQGRWRAGTAAKVVQERLGHAWIVMTMDVYGHLFPRGDDTAELAAAERLLIGPPT